LTDGLDADWTDDTDLTDGLDADWTDDTDLTDGLVQMVLTGWLLSIPPEIAIQDIFPYFDLLKLKMT